FYDEGKYDIAGFSVGIVDKKKIIDGKNIQEGDVLVGIASSGPHSNGFSLIRKVLPDLNEDFGGMPLGYALLEPTRIYIKPMVQLLEQTDIRGMAHITGGGFYENIPRMFPGSAVFDAVIKDGSWTIPPIFARIAAGAAGLKERGVDAQEAGAKLLETDDSLRKQMFNTYNMGIGFVLALAPGDSRNAVEFLDDRGFPAWEIGRVETGSGVVRFER
ncbi:MAG: phosphoribosylformylglycinamidine cyclo-ligase, partial [Treponema sp.]|nr:phosphoribosylformylglycinamidine cyclo-ligase [Treponema sp.]